MKEFKYKGYFGSVDAELDTGMLIGRLLFISDVIAYSGTTVPELKAAFEETVDDYLATCKELGDEPELPCKGSFNVRVGQDLHRDVALYARRHGMTLNEVVITGLDELMKKDVAKHHHHLHHHEVVVKQTVVEDRAVAGGEKGTAWHKGSLVVN
jgi:predicted HicB family RNase H-like nuclease